MFPQSFEKDDDSNGHIDFITAASVSALTVFVSKWYWFLNVDF